VSTYTEKEETRIDCIMEVDYKFNSSEGKHTHVRAHTEVHKEIKEETKQRQT
jgi:hypothetical protein